MKIKLNPKKASNKESKEMLPTTAAMRQLTDNQFLIGVDMGAYMKRTGDSSALLSSRFGIVRDLKPSTEGFGERVFFSSKMLADFHHYHNGKVFNPPSVVKDANGVLTIKRFTEMPEHCLLNEVIVNIRQQLLELPSFKAAINEVIQENLYDEEGDETGFVNMSYEQQVETILSIVSSIEDEDDEENDEETSVAYQGVKKLAGLLDYIYSKSFAEHLVNQNLSFNIYSSNFREHAVDMCEEGLGNQERKTSIFWFKVEIIINLDEDKLQNLFGAEAWNAFSLRLIDYDITEGRLRVSDPVNAAVKASDFQLKGLKKTRIDQEAKALKQSVANIGNQIDQIRSVIDHDSRANYNRGEYMRTHGKTKIDGVPVPEVTPVPTGGKTHANRGEAAKAARKAAKNKGVEMNQVAPIPTSSMINIADVDDEGTI